MADKRGLWERLVSSFARAPSTLTDTKLVDVNTNHIYLPAPDTIYAVPDVRTAIDFIARKAAQVEYRHVRQDKRERVEVKSDVNRVLTLRANEYESPYDLMYRVVSNLMVTNNAFILPRFDPDNGRLAGLYVIDGTAEAVFKETASGTPYVEFRYYSRPPVCIEYASLIHLRRHNIKQFGGESNAPIQTLVQILTLGNNAMANNLQSNGRLTGIITLKTQLNEADLEKYKTRFVTNYMNFDNSSGIAVLDGGKEFKEVNVRADLLNFDQEKILLEKVYRYFGVNGDLLSGLATETQFNQFIDTCVEPIVRQVEQEFSYKLFTDESLNQGNRIRARMTRAIISPLSSKGVFYHNALVDGWMTVNEVRDEEGLNPTEGGDTVRVSLNNVNAAKADAYQGVGGDTSGP
jgi:HK97 family phage portal protein